MKEEILVEHRILFGWIFGLISEENSRFPGAIQVDQYNYYDRNNKNNIQYRKVYVPSTLREVYITDENCNWLWSIL